MPERLDAVIAPLELIVFAVILVAFNWFSSALEPEVMIFFQFGILYNIAVGYTKCKVPTSLRGQQFIIDIKGSLRCGPFSIHFCFRSVYI